MTRASIFRAMAALACLGGTVFAVQVGPDDGTVQNGISAFEIDVDGVFSGGVSSGQVNGEWSDVDPLAFISPPVDNPTAPHDGLLRTHVGDPAANALLYAVIAPGVGNPVEDLYLMYDYLPRTDPVFGPGEEIARIEFPVTHQGSQKNIDVIIMGTDNTGTPVVEDLDGDGVATPRIDSFFDVFVEVDLGGSIPPSDLGIEAAIGFQRSELSSLSHMLIELEVALLIPPGFGPGFPTAGLPGAGGNGYDPDPAFWGAEGKNDAIDPPISAAIFTINPDGSTIASSSAANVPLSVIPEPGTLVLLGLGSCMMALGSPARRRRAI